MKNFILIVAGAACFLPAMRAADALPKADTILDRYIEVTGGKAAYENQKTQIAAGTLFFASQGVKAAIVRYAAVPDKYYSTMDIQGVGKVELGFSGGVAWEKSALLGARIKSGEERAQAVRESTMHASLYWRKLFKSAETTGMETVNGEDCYKVLLTPFEGRPESMYFQKKSGLAVKYTTTAVTQMGEVPVEIMVSDYKDFGGILVPAKTTQKAAGQEFTVTIESVKVNQEIPAATFELPAEIKALQNKSAK